ncbi:hypothetical protein GCM10012285_00910 [Streptomyces kronopolitis]|uniref:Uncharacterized protein n=1 Tax=Streptomyces kronopolitis TaxID=1612435 RepID=A0ABQ2IUK3_9ACTN|nr:hypothetical protein GCM10012285_00910 [Streptomyces kronopolitis]
MGCGGPGRLDGGQGEGRREARGQQDAARQTRRGHLNLRKGVGGWVEVEAMAFTPQGVTHNIVM